MIKLKQILLEGDTDENDSEIDVDRLYQNSMYRSDILEKLGYHYEFNTQFWEHPSVLYHCTSTENLQSIRTNGLTCQDKTRGINNRSVGSAIFTTQDKDEVESVRQSYGPLVITINTRAMKQDGYTPFVTQEPEVEDAEELLFIFNKMGHEDVNVSQFIDSGDGISEYTVIVHENIPPKYLTITES